MFTNKVILSILLLFLVNSKVWSFFQLPLCETDSIRTFKGDLLSINEVIYFFRDTNNLSVQSVGASDFQPNFNLINPQDTLVDGETYWLKFTLKNDYAPYPFADRFYLLIPILSKTAYLYVKNPYTSEYIESISTVRNLHSFQANNKRTHFLQTIAKTGFELPLFESAYLTYFIKIKCIGEPVPYSPKYGRKFLIVPLETTQMRKYGGRNYEIFIYMGGLLGMIVFTFGIFFFLREISLLYYLLFCISMLIYNLYPSNMLGALHPELFITYPKIYHSFQLSSHIAIFGFLFFIRTYLDLKQFLPIWDKLFYWIGIIVLFSLAYDFFKLYIDFEHPLTWFNERLDRLFWLTTPIALLFIVFFFYLKKIPTKRKYFLIFGVACMIIAVIYIAIVYYNKGRISTTDYRGLLLFTSLEFIFFALGFAYRIKENEAEKQQVFLELQTAENTKKINELEYQKLQEINQFKDRFYTNITHEFRTPLTVINGMASHIKGKYDKESRLIRRNSQNILHLVNQMLDLSKIESGALQIEYQNSDIVAFLQMEMEAYIVLATSNNIRLHFYSNEANLTMDFDPQKLRHIVANLLSNAIKFIDKGGHITVHLQKRTMQNKSVFEFEISDTGVGIPDDKLPFIFDRFYQVDNSNTRLGEGTGIGLALTKELVEMMKGEIHVSSTIGKGTTFIIRLPITQNAPQRDKDGMTDASNFLASSTTVNFPVLENIDHPIALIIEDNEDVIQYLVTCLQDHFRILTAINGEEGIRVAKEHLPNIIISDVMMPKVDGYEVTKQLKADERTSHIPIVLLTAKADHTSKLEGLEAGADAYLDKPFDKGELMIRLEKLIEIRKKLQAHYARQNPMRATKEEQLSKETVFLQKIRNYIEKRLDDSEYGVDALAKDMFLSRQQLYRKVKALTGKSVAVYMRLIRLHFAKQLLQNTHLRVNEVAYRVGFNEPSYFSKCYIEAFGYPPKEEKKG